MKPAIQARARELGFDVCRFTSAATPGSAPRFRDWIEAGRHGEMAYLARNADKRANPQLVLPGAQSVICLAASYHASEFASGSLPTKPSGDGVVARYARFADYHDALAERLQNLAAFVDQLGPPGTQSRTYVDTGPVLERDLAQRAGVGFIGKHTNLISRELGNWFFLAEILTTLEILPDSPERNRCGACTRCLGACPTAAIIEPFVLDARRCISYLTIELKGAIPQELRPAIGNRIFGCDDCLAACPWNRFAREGRLMGGHRRRDFDTPDLVGMLRLDDATFKARFAGTPLARSKRRGLLRNVCVALGNVGDATALPPLQTVAVDTEPLIAEHARWAINQIEARAAARP